MSWIDDAVSDFGRTMGLEPLAFNSSGVINLVFEVSGALYLERADSALLVYLCREIDRPSAELYAAALELCHWRHNHDYPVNAALHQDKTLVFSVRLTEEQVSVPALEQVIQLLDSLQNETQQEAHV